MCVSNLVESFVYFFPEKGKVLAPEGSTGRQWVEVREADLDRILENKKNFLITRIMKNKSLPSRDSKFSLTKSLQIKAI